MARKEEEGVRAEAINQYLQGEKPKLIYEGLGYSKQWFFKWLKRYQSGDPQWFREQSKTPHSTKNRICEVVENRIVEIRRELQNTRYAQIGANAINWQLQKAGMDPVVISTINRVIKRRGLVKRKEKYQPFGKRLSWFALFESKQYSSS